MLASAPVANDGVAMSGIAARGTHILNPWTGRGTSAVLSATVVGPSLLWADVFATAAVAQGSRSHELVEGLCGTSGLLVLANGTCTAGPTRRNRRRAARPTQAGAASSAGGAARLNGAAPVGTGRSRGSAPPGP